MFARAPPSGPAARGTRQQGAQRRAGQVSHAGHGALGHHVPGDGSHHGDHEEAGQQGRIDLPEEAAAEQAPALSALVLHAGEDVARPAHGDDAPRVGRVSSRSGAQPRDMHVHRAVEGLQLVAPDQVQQTLARKHPAGVAGQGQQQVELIGGEADVAPSILTAREPGSISSRPKRRAARAAGPSRRRKIAFSRACSSRGLNGLGR